MGCTRNEMDLNVFNKGAFLEESFHRGSLEPYWQSRIDPLGSFSREERMKVFVEEMNLGLRSQIE